MEDGRRATRMQTGWRMQGYSHPKWPLCPADVNLYEITGPSQDVYEIGYGGSIYYIKTLLLRREL